MDRSLLSSDSTRIFRHLVATIAYRASHSLRDAPAGFENVRLPPDGMSAGELVLHMTNVLAFALAILTHTDRHRHDALPWPEQVTRFYRQLGEIDARLEGGVELEEEMELKLIQGPLSDTLTHIGQLHALRRQAGAPIARANYIQAEVRAGRTGLDEQSR